MPERQDPEILKLYCVVLDQPRSSIFSIKIAKTMDVATLKEAIKAKKQTFKHVDADALSLWGTSFPEDGLEENLDQFNFDALPLSAMKKLCNVFPDPPMESCLHIVVRGPCSECEWGSSLLQC